MRLNDLFSNDSIMLETTQRDLREVAGVGLVVKGVNTTPDVGVDEIPRQAAKFKIKVNRQGYPPVARTDGKGAFAK